MEAVRPTHLLRTDGGKAFHLEFDAGYSLAMSLDVAKLLLQLRSYGRPRWVPSVTDLSTAGWDVIRKNYVPGQRNGHRTLIKASGMTVAQRTPYEELHGAFLELGYSLIDCQGTTLLTLAGASGTHELLWHRDDENHMWLFLDPLTGLWQFDGLVGVAPYLAAEFAARYSALSRDYQLTTLRLAP